MHVKILEMANDCTDVKACMVRLVLSKQITAIGSSDDCWGYKCGVYASCHLS